MWKDTGDPHDYNYIQSAINPFLGPEGIIFTYKADENQLDSILTGRELLVLGSQTMRDRWFTPLLVKKLINGGKTHKLAPAVLWPNNCFVSLSELLTMKICPPLSGLVVIACK